MYANFLEYFLLSKLINRERKGNFNIVYAGSFFIFEYCKSKNCHISKFSNGKLYKKYHLWGHYGRL